MYDYKKYNKNQAEFYFKINSEDGTLVKEGVFERFPLLRPAVGENYWREDGKHKKMLIVGESNYFKKEMERDSVFLNPEEWYKGDTDKLIPESMVNDVSNWKGYKTFIKVYNIAQSVLQEAGINCFTPKNKQDEFCFYNYFLRPALNGGKDKGFNSKEIDRKVSGLALTEIISRLEIDLVVFISTKAYNAYSAYMKIEKDCTLEACPFKVQFHRVVHPSCAWWNRNNGAYGKNKLKDILNQYWINK